MGVAIPVAAKTKHIYCKIDIQNNNKNIEKLGYNINISINYCMLTLHIPLVPPDIQGLMC